MRLRNFGNSIIQETKPKKENYQRDRKTYWIGVCITICIEYKICKIILSDFNIYRSH